MAALIDAGTGYSTIADWSDTTPQPDSASSGAALWAQPITSFLWPTFLLLPAETGYSTIADWFDTTPQPNFAASLASLTAYYNSIIEGRLIDLGGGSKEMWGIIG
jgi:hypothetical protein